MESKKSGADGRRTWRKLHLVVDPGTHPIVTQSLTENSVHDSDQVESDVDTFYGDGVYDPWKVHASLEDQEIEAIIPPRKNAKIQQHGNSSEKHLPRNESIREIRREGRQSWKESFGIIAWRKRLCSA